MAVAVATLACAPDAGSDADRLVEQGRDAYIAGDYERARDLFRSAGPGGADPHLAALGIARSYQQLHDYNAALLTYQRALDLGPQNALTWQGYLETLYWAGVLGGDGRRLEEVLEAAPDALRAAPNNVEIYQRVLETAAELNRLEAYGEIVADLATALPDEPVAQIELAKVRLQEARRRSNAARAAARTDANPTSSAEVEGLAATVEELETALRGELEATMRSDSPEVPVGVYYKLAAGRDLLGEAELAETALDALERQEGGREMAAPLRYEQFLGEWVGSVNADLQTRLEITDRWLQRFAPQWSDDGTRYRAVLGMQFGALVTAAREAFGAGDGEFDAELAERVADVGRRLARTDTWRGATHYVETASILARVPSQYVTAVRVTDDGIEALTADRPGLIYPGTPQPTREELRMRYLSVLMQLQGQALHNLGRDDEAETVLRNAIAQYPVAASYAVLGGLLLDQGRSTEAFDLLVAALAHGFGSTEVALERQVRASAIEAAGSIGASADVVDAAIAFAADRIAEERDRAIVAEPLDVPAPDFELEDLAGTIWRLSELAGQVVVLNYWATWCAPCIAEMPYYQSLVNEYADADVVFLAISTDRDTSVVAPFIEQSGYEFTVLYDRDSADAFDVSGVPATIVIGADGSIKYRTAGFPGPEPYLHEMRLRIEALRQTGQ